MADAPSVGSSLVQRTDPVPQIVRDVVRVCQGLPRRVGVEARPTAWVANAAQRLSKGQDIESTVEAGREVLL
jgi:hypothetical protein